MPCGKLFDVWSRRIIKKRPAVGAHGVDPRGVISGVCTSTGSSSPGGGLKFGDVSPGVNLQGTGLSPAFGQSSSGGNVLHSVSIRYIRYTNTSHPVVKYTVCGKYLPFSTEIAVYLGNSSRYGHGYYGSLIGSQMPLILSPLLAEIWSAVIERQT